MHVLVVDDDEQIARMLDLFLRKTGIEVTTINSAADTIHWLGRNICDAVILDISMPDGNGITLLPEIRQAIPRAPVIIFTGLGYDSDLMRQARAAGAAGFVSKGMPPEEVLVALRRAMDTHAK